MRTKQYRVALTEAERVQLRLLVRRGQAKAQVVLRAHILLEADADAFDHDNARALHTSVDTVRRVRRRFAEAAPTERLDRALYDRPRPGAQPMLDGKAEAFLIALACSEAPEGRTHWTMPLLADWLVEVGVVPAISDETVRRRLKRAR